MFRLEKSLNPFVCSIQSVRECMVPPPPAPRPLGVAAPAHVETPPFTTLRSASSGAQTGSQRSLNF